MNELQLERLENMISNPYTWLLVAFIMILPYLLKYLRRFYPDTLRERMDKEEACNLEYQQKPEMKLLRKVLIFGIIGSITISYLIVYYMLGDIENKLGMFKDILVVMIFIVLFVVIDFELSIKKDNKEKNCNDVVGYEFMKIAGIISGIIFFALLIIVVLKEWKVF